jgi:hypothetical protein
MGARLRIEQREVELGKIRRHMAEPAGLIPAPNAVSGQTEESMQAEGGDGESRGASQCGAINRIRGAQ